MPEISAENQLNVFETFRGILLGNDVLAKRFRKSDFYEFEPNLHSMSYGMTPYIVINIPSNEEDPMVYSGETNTPRMRSEIVLVVGYEARDKVKTYGGEIIRQFKEKRDYLESLGYYNAKVTVSTSPTVELIENKQVVTLLLNLDYTTYNCL